MDEVVSCSLSLLSVSSRVLRDVDFQSVKQTDRSSDKEGHGRPEHPDAGADGRSDRTLGGRSGKIHVVRTLLFVVSQQRFNDLLLVCQMFVNFRENGLVTCSADHLLILWKNGERQSHLRSLALFEKLEESGGL